VTVGAADVDADNDAAAAASDDGAVQTTLAEAGLTAASCCLVEAMALSRDE